jgi:transposase-like protein
VGYEKGDAAGRGNSGHSSKTVLTEDGQIGLAAPRDRDLSGFPCGGGRLNTTPRWL